MTDTRPCQRCLGRGIIPGVMEKKYIRGIGYKSVPLKCSTCKGTGRVNK